MRDEVKHDAEEKPVAAAGSNKTVKYVIIVIVVLVVLGYAAKFVIGSLGMMAVNAQLKSQGITMTGNPLTGNPATGAPTYNFKDEKGNQVTVGAGTKLPDDFPKNVPMYDGTIIANSSSIENGKKMFMVSLQSTDAFDKVVGFYKSGLSSGGWKIMQEANLAAGYTMMSAEKDDAQVNVMIQSANADGKDQTTVTLTTGAK